MLSETQEKTEKESLIHRETLDARLSISDTKPKTNGVAKIRGLPLSRVSTPEICAPVSFSGKEVKEMKKVGLYARVSTTDKGQDPELQLRDLRSYAQARGWSVFKEYVDNGVSGSKDKRPMLDAMMNDARKRKIDLILCWRLDRLGRSLKHLILTLDELQSLGVGFVSYSENLDLTTSTGRLMFQLLGAFAEFEKNLIQEKVRAGLSNARAKGKHLGRPEKGLDRERLFEMRGRGLTMRAIAQSLDCSPALVYKTLQIRGENPQCF